MNESVPARRAPAGIVQQPAEDAVEAEHDVRAFLPLPRADLPQGFAVADPSRSGSSILRHPGFHGQHRDALRCGQALLAFQESRAPVVEIESAGLIEDRQPDPPEPARPGPVPRLLHGAEMVGHHQMHRRSFVAFAAGHGHKARPVKGRAKAGRMNLPDNHAQDAAGIEHVRQSARIGVVPDLEGLEFVAVGGGALDHPIPAFHGAVGQHRQCRTRRHRPPVPAMGGQCRKHGVGAVAQFPSRAAHTRPCGRGQAGTVAKCPGDRGG